MALRRLLIGLGVMALALGSCGKPVQRGDLPEAPTPGWTALGLPPGWTVQHVKPGQADAICRAAGVAVTDAYNRRQIADCAIPSQHTVVMADTGDPVLDQAVMAHEAEHAWGPVHHDNHGWYWPDGREVQPIRPAEAGMMQSMALAQLRQTQAQPAQGLLALGQGQGAQTATPTPPAAPNPLVQALRTAQN